MRAELIRRREIVREIYLLHGPSQPAALRSFGIDILEYCRDRLRAPRVVSIPLAPRFFPVSLQFWTLRRPQHNGRMIFARIAVSELFDLRWPAESQPPSRCPRS